MEKGSVIPYILSSFFLTSFVTMPAITVDHLSKTYSQGAFQRRSVRALDDLTLEVQRGEIFGFLGPNGSGKTTLIKMLLSLVHPTSGSAAMLDVPLPDTKVRERVGYLPENHRYPSYMTGEGVLTQFGRLSGVAPAAMQPRVNELLQVVGMEQWRRTKVKRYSKGMLQRIGLAQALINNPDLVFLDEPTDGVDPVGRKEIRDMLKGLRDRGTTIFLNSHLLSEVELLCDRVAIVNKGKLLKVGTIASLTDTGSRHVIGIAGDLPEAFAVEASATVMNLEQRPGALAINAPTIADLNRAIDMLRRHGVSITSIEKEKTSLEESFLALLKKEVAS